MSGHSDKEHPVRGSRYTNHCRVWGSGGVQKEGGWKSEQEKELL